MRFIGCGFASQVSKALEFFGHFRLTPLQIAMEDFLQCRDFAHWPF